MYGNTEKMMDVVAQGIAASGLPLKIFDAARTHVSYILPSLWVYRGVMIGAPTYEGALFPPVLDVLNHAALKRIMNKKAAMFGSYGWSGGAVRNARQIIEPLKWELTDTLEFAGYPSHEELAKAAEFGRKFAELIKAG
jgi:flavorubredoxin